MSYFAPRTLSQLLTRHALHVERSMTFGFGIDELIARDESGAGAPVDHPEPRRPARSGVLKRIAKRTLKRVILDSGLGENVMIVARPRVG